jgi:hypothetical protein
MPVQHAGCPTVRRTGVSHILALMVARLIAVAAALVITGAPVVTTACEGICAVRVSDSRATGERHSCHHEPASTPSEVSLTAAAHVCGHSEEGPRAVDQSLWLLAAPVAVVETLTFVPPSPESLRFEGGPNHGPPIVAPRSTQLRI